MGLCHLPNLDTGDFIYRLDCAPDQINYQCFAVLRKAQPIKFPNGDFSNKMWLFCTRSDLFNFNSRLLKTDDVYNNQHLSCFDSTLPIQPRNDIYGFSVCFDNYDECNHIKMKVMEYSMSHQRLLYFLEYMRVNYEYSE